MWTNRPRRDQDCKRKEPRGCGFPAERKKEVTCKSSIVARTGFEINGNHPTQGAIMKTQDVFGRIMARLDRSRKEWDDAEISDKDFDAKMGLHRTLNSLVTVLHEAMVFAGYIGRLRIFTVIRNQLIGPDENEDALPVKFQPLEDEKYMELWNPFIIPIPDGKMGEWFSDPEKSKPILVAKLKELRENLKTLKEVCYARK